MRLVRRLRERKCAAGIAAARSDYERQLPDPDPRSTQLGLWNQVWPRLCREVPFYRRLAEEAHLPSSFSSWEQFIALVPVVTRGLVQGHLAQMTSQERPADFYRTTGGSTAEPVQLPAWKSERQFTAPPMWMARGWYGVSPSSKPFLLWGHAHLLGRGVKGWLRARKRQLLDALLGYTRHSAYDLTQAALRRGARRLLRARPEYIVGYGVALDLFARANRDLRDALRALELRVVIGTAESFPRPDSSALLEDLFGCPVAMEYGAVETDDIAYTHPLGGYHVFWRNYFIEAERVARTALAWKLRVTSLYPRCFPLVRYELGDELELEDGAADVALAVHRFKRLLGRCYDYVALPDGASIHSTLFNDVVRGYKEIHAYQVVQGDNPLTLNYLADHPLSADQTKDIQRRLARVAKGLAAIRVERVERLKQTSAGKTPMIIRQR